MAATNDSVSMALFCDFENVALGVRDANYEKFDIKKVLERLLLKGSIVVKKAYCDWERYKGFKAAMHEANFELIEIPHVRQSGKNSADIRLVVDALDLCYTKSHVDTFVIISGDSDFSPLVSKLRENAKQVIGVGVKQSTSDLLIANCDEFIFYDDLVREGQRSGRKETREAQPAARRTLEEETRRKDELEQRRGKAIELAAETFEALLAERGESGKIWASMLKEAIKRRNPGFNESYYGFRVFSNLLEEAQSRGLLMVGRDEKSGAYVYRGSGDKAVPGAGDSIAVRGEATAPRSEPHAARGETAAHDSEAAAAASPVAEASEPAAKSERGRRGGARKRKSHAVVDEAVSHPAEAAVAHAEGRMSVAETVAGTSGSGDSTAGPAGEHAIETATEGAGTRRRGRAGSKGAGRAVKGREPAVASSAASSEAQANTVVSEVAAHQAPAAAPAATALEAVDGAAGQPVSDKPARKSGARSGSRAGAGRGRPRKNTGTGEAQ